MLKLFRTAIIGVVLTVSSQDVRATTNQPIQTNVLPPFAYAVFCREYPFECKATPQKAPFRVTDARLKELEDVNELVNLTIRAAAIPADFVRDRWLINPSFGNCHDYAVSKRYELLRRGWPSERLLLAEVVQPASGEHHLVLLVKTQSTTWVLDNLQANISRITDIRSQYIWLRAQTSENPQLWTTAFNF